MRHLLPCVLAGCSVLPQRPPMPLPVTPKPAPAPPAVAKRAAAAAGVTPSTTLLPPVWVHHGEDQYLLADADQRRAFELACLHTAPATTPCNPSTFRYPDQVQLERHVPSDGGRWRVSLHLKPTGIDASADLFVQNPDGTHSNSCDIRFDIATGDFVFTDVTCFWSPYPRSAR